MRENRDISRSRAIILRGTERRFIRISAYQYRCVSAETSSFSNDRPPSVARGLCGGMAQAHAHRGGSEIPQKSSKKL